MFKWDQWRTMGTSSASVISLGLISKKSSLSLGFGKPMRALTVKWKKRIFFLVQDAYMVPVASM